MTIEVSTAGAILKESMRRQDCTLQLTSPFYDFGDCPLVIKNPIKFKSHINPTVKCKCIMIEAPDVEISGITVNGRISISSDNVIIRNTNIELLDYTDGMAAMSILKSVNVLCENITISNINIEDCYIRGMFISQKSEVTIRSSHFFNVKAGFIRVGSSIVDLIYCDFDGSDFGIEVIEHGKVNVNHCQMHNIFKNAMSVFDNGHMKIFGSEIYDSNGVYFGSSVENVVEKCRIHHISTSAIMALNHSEVKVINNSFEHVEGNCLYLSHESKAEFYNNTCNYSTFPAMIANTKSFVHVKSNKISNLKKNGFAIRMYSRAIIEDNIIESADNSGISVSETKNCVIRNNIIKNCKYVGIEVTNDAVVHANKNDISETVVGISCSAGGFIYAFNNVIKEIQKSAFQLRYYGGGDFRSNVIENCPELTGGETSGKFFMKNNGSFENLTNNSSKTDPSMKYIKSYIDEHPGKCLKCHERPREGVCLPCGHFVFCDLCGNEPDQKKCPICYETVKYQHSYEEDCQLCIICCEKPADAIMFPCCHCGYCVDCLLDWCAIKAECPVCRQEIQTIKAIITNI